jgi:hypothetical protein
MTETVVICDFCSEKRTLSDDQTLVDLGKEGWLTAKVEYLGDTKAIESRFICGNCSRSKPLSYLYVFYG